MASFNCKHHGVIHAGQKQCDVAARADAAHAHDFSGDIHDVIAVQDDAAFFGQRQTVAMKQRAHVLVNFCEVARMINERRVVKDAALAIGNLGDFRQKVFSRLHVGGVLHFSPIVLVLESFGLV